MFDGAGVHGLTPAGPPIRLGEYRANLVRLMQRIECRNGELRRAGEAQPQGAKIGAQSSKSRRGGARRGRAGLRTSNLAARGSLSPLLFQAPADQLALEFGEIVDE